MEKKTALVSPAKKLSSFRKAARRYFERLVTAAKKNKKKVK